jgi:hypothetical protein
MRLDSNKRPIPITRFLPASPITLSLSVVSARVQLAPGTKYRIWPSVDCFIKFGIDTVVATTTEHPLTAKYDPLHDTDNTNFWVAGIVSSGTGIIFFSELDLDSI